MLRLRRGVVVDLDPLTVEVDGERRRAWADVGLVGEASLGDEVVVNTAAVELGLGSGGLDVVHVNLSRGVAPNGDSTHVMKLNYTSLQHPVEPVETEEPTGSPVPVLAIMLHGQLGPAAWAAAEHRPGLRLGYVQTAGGALPGSWSRVVQELRGRGLLCGHVTVAPAYGGEAEAISLVGALDAAASLGWDAAIAGPGPGIVGSGSAYGHGGMMALDVLHAALALGAPALLAPRISATDPRPRHRGVSHHTETVLRLLLSPVRVAVPTGLACARGLTHAVTAAGHLAVTSRADKEGYAGSGLPAETMGRSLEEDPEFFAAALAAGTALAAVVDQTAAPGED